MGRLTLDAIFLLNLGGTLDGGLVAVIPEGNIGARLGVGIRDGQANASSGTCDDGSLALQREEREDAIGSGGRLGVAGGELPSAINQRTVHLFFLINTGGEIG